MAALARGGKTTSQALHGTILGALAGNSMAALARHGKTTVTASSGKTTPPSLPSTTSILKGTWVHGRWKEEEESEKGQEESEEDNKPFIPDRTSRSLKSGRGALQKKERNKTA